MKGLRIMKKVDITLNLSTLIAAVLFLAGCWLIFSGWKEIKQTEIRNQAMFQCASISSYTTEDEAGATVSFPVEDVYAKCLDEKGVK